MATTMHKLPNIDKEKSEGLVNEYRNMMEMDLSRLRRVRDEFLNQMESGLRCHDDSKILMLPTCVDVLPTGSETGEYYAIDMGGTNFRVLYTKLSDSDGEVELVESEQCKVGPDYMCGSADKLFDLLAGSLVDFAARNAWELGPQQPIGFCFSFPMEHRSISEGRLLKWTKGYSLVGAVGEDVTQLLTDAFRRRGVEAAVLVLTNDTVTSLAAARYQDPDCTAGVILGTGTNAAYIESLGRITKHQAGKELEERDMMVISTEWGNFADDQLPSTPEDSQIDAESLNPGEQVFEKMSSGLYLGEIASRILLRLATETGLFGHKVPPRLKALTALESPDLATIDSDESLYLQTTARVLKERLGLEPKQMPQRVLKLVREVCRLVAARGAGLAAAGIAAIVAHIDGAEAAMSMPERHHHTIAVDGSVFLHYDKFRHRLVEAVQQLLGPDQQHRVQLKATPDGSSIGAALLAAAVAQKRSVAPVQSNGV